MVLRQYLGSRVSQGHTVHHEFLKDIHHVQVSSQARGGEAAAVERPSIEQNIQTVRLLVSKEVLKNLHIKFYLHN